MSDPATDAINAVFTDRSAGRWCEQCRQHGSHHTERHDDFASHAVQTLAERAKDLIGKIVRDTTVVGAAGTYAIGATGFMCLADGTFLRYDSAFPGPEYFTNPVFEVLDLASPTGAR